MDEDNLKHKRRVRYSGKNPTSFLAKYKELNPDKYSDIIEKVIQKGNTPAGTHRSICVNEIIDFLKIKPKEIGIDATLGYGGHTTEMLKCLNGEGHIYAIDADPIELPKTKERLLKLGYDEDILTIINMNFSDIDKIKDTNNFCDFVLADLGVSSMQIDNPLRGFSFKTDGPLDLRMNPNIGISAANRLKNMNSEEIQGMLEENSDEPNASKIASAIITYYKTGNKISTTTDLQKIIKDTLKFLPANVRDLEIKKSCQRTFQALRIDVNHEYESLYTFLEKIPSVLNSHGRIAILSFHSGEDRLVKKSFQYYFRQGIYSAISSEPIRPSMEEQNSNSRAKSAKLRWAIKA